MTLFNVKKSQIKISRYQLSLVYDLFALDITANLKIKNLSIKLYTPNRKQVKILIPFIRKQNASTCQITFIEY